MSELREKAREKLKEKANEKLGNVSLVQACSKKMLLSEILTLKTRWKLNLLIISNTQLFRSPERENDSGWRSLLLPVLYSVSHLHLKTQELQN